MTSIINHASSNEQSNIEAWELEILPCEHTLTLHQAEGVKILSKSLATCNDCSLSSNLWLCLTCGNLGCGRKNYDGSGGNSHAIGHYDKTQHPLVVKTGTITPDGNACIIDLLILAIYCYACNNDVKDPELTLHLSKFGIDVSSAVKTEKTMTEMNLDFNLNLTLSKTLEEGKVLTPIYGAGYTGMENLGNSCYMNSVLQILFSLEPFQALYFDEAVMHLNSCHEDPTTCFTCQISKIFFGLYSGAYSSLKTRQLPALEEGKHGEIEEYQKGIRPSYFKNFMAKDHPEFLSNKQQDSFEYLSYLLEQFEKQERKTGRPNPKHAFEFDLETRLECSKCQSVKYKTFRNWYLPLAVPNWENKKEESATCSIEDSINKFLGEEAVDLQCTVCKEGTKYIKTQRLKNFPKYLIVVFERFVYDWVPIKLEVQFQTPLSNLNLSVLTSSHSKQNEKIIEEQVSTEQSETEVEPTFNQNDLNALISNGVPELAAKHALLSTNNNVDEALMWFYTNIDNPGIQL